MEMFLILIAHVFCFEESIWHLRNAPKPHSRDWNELIRVCASRKPSNVYIIITYGLEVTEITDEAINMLENSHWASAKEIQNLPQNTPNPAVLPQIGWFTLNGHIDFMRLMFLWRIFLMPSMNIYKIVAIHRIVDYFSNITRKGPIRMILETARKYDLLDVIKDSVFEGFYIPKSMACELRLYSILIKLFDNSS